MREYPRYRDDLKSQVLEFTWWWEDYIFDATDWPRLNKRSKLFANASLYACDGLKFVCCLIKGHDYGENMNAYGPREYCYFCEMSKPGVLIRRKDKNDEIARHWPLKPKEIK